MSVKQKCLIPESRYISLNKYILPKYTVAITTGREYDFSLQPFLFRKKESVAVFRLPRAALSNFRLTVRLATAGNLNIPDMARF